MKKTEIAEGLAVVEVPEVGLSVLCGCPENAVKFLVKRGIIRETERDGRRFETGPNAILLSEAPVMKGRFLNLAEFPVLQMLYRQGKIVPGHPNNDGQLPMLIGMRAQVEAQSRYIYRGNYGLASVEELERAGMDRSGAEELFRMKLKFAFGSFRRSEELLDLRIIDGYAVELKDGLFIRRLGMNRYEFIHGGEAVEVDLSGIPRYAPYHLPFCRASREYFSVVHIGEGDGWDAERPCMGAVLVFRGEPYLVDAGPNIEESLEAIGLGVNDLRGIFHTHAHDDHFVGLTALMRADHRLKYFAVPYVRASVTQKLCALTGLGEGDFGRYFEVHDLAEGKWNMFEGLEVMPLLSPHPVETTVLWFRALGKDGYRSYAHLADLASFAVMDSMTTADPSAPGLSAAFVSRVKASYLERADLKKVDIGGGMIHGSAADFAGDESTILLLSHASGPLPEAQKSIGSTASFGGETRLIEARLDYAASLARDQLAILFPSVPRAELEILLNCDRESIDEGRILYRKGEAIEEVHLVLSGMIELLDQAKGEARSLSSGSLAGDEEVLDGVPAIATYRSRSKVEAIRIPADVYVEFLRRNGLGDKLADIMKVRNELQASPLFADMLSMSAISSIASAAKLVRIAPGEPLGGGDAALYVIAEGRALILANGSAIETLGPGGFFGEERILYGDCCLFEAKAEGAVGAWRIPAPLIEDKPILLWRLRESHERRLVELRGFFRIEWRPEYSVGRPEIDEQHAKLFSLIDELNGKLETPGRCPDAASDLDALRLFAAGHFATEEKFMTEGGYPDLPAHAAAHARLLGDFAAYRERFDCGDESALKALALFLKDYVMRHTLLMDRRYMPWIGRAR